MIILKNNQVYSDQDKYIRRVGSETYFKRSMVLPSDTLEDFEEIDELPKYTKAQYDEMVAKLIREKYSQDEENAIKSKVLATMIPNELSEEDSAKYLEQFRQFNEFREECKIKAKDSDLYDNMHQAL